MKYLYLPFFIFFYLLSNLSFLTAQDSTDIYIYVNRILVDGTKKTKDYIIFREMDITVGDSIPLSKIEQVLERNRKQIMNTGLFSWIKLNLKDWNIETNQVTVFVEAAETWYIYPIPIFELADRNFNVWWVDQQRSLTRVNFGIKLSYNNFLGHNDRLGAKVQFGYTNKLELDYGFPFINQKETIGLYGNVLYTRNKEIVRNTILNRQDFYRDDDAFLFHRFRIGARLTFRPGLRTYQNFGLRFHRNRINDQVAIPELNSNYFLENRTKQRYFALYYDFIYDNRDIKAYPLKGNYFSINVNKEGLGIFEERNYFSVAPKYAQYVKLSPKISLETMAKARLFLIQEQQAYYNNRALGYAADFLRGYEYYVIDGQNYAYFKTSWRYEFFDGIVNYGKHMPLEFLRLMPLRVYGKLNFDTGHVRELYYADNNPFVNRMLYGGGIALDLVIYYDKVIQIEYSINHLGERGIFLHLKLF